MARFSVVKLPFWHLLWLLGYRYTHFMVGSLPSCPFCGRYVTIITPFKIGKLPLGPVLWLAGYHYGPFHGWKVAMMAQFIVEKLQLWPVLSLVSFN